ncbi:MAG: hypothetical protein WBE10_17510, partial [Candidatus Acidiferrum sp.]
MELAATQEARPWERPFWKPVRGKEGVFAYLVLIHALALIGLILFPLPSLKVLGLAVLFIAFGGLGTTFRGGHGGGTVFRISTTGKERVLYSFHGRTDGSEPVASLI